MVNVAVLGASGMLGSMVVSVLRQDPQIRLTATTRGDAPVAASDESGMVRWRHLDAAGQPDLEVLSGNEWIVNAIGITKPLIREDNFAERERAVQVNAVFPHVLAHAAMKTGARVLQIATDCVFSGKRGAYVEADEHDALDVYGKTKSLGEVPHERVHHLRCSIIGPEPRDHKFLLDWVRRQPRGAKLSGYTNHRWNGVTTLHFARVVQGIIKAGVNLPRLQHVIPSGDMTKADMLRLIAAVYGRDDIVVDDVEAKITIDRTLQTSQAEVNQHLWQSAGYQIPPTVEQMIREVAAFRAAEQLAPADR